MSTRPRSRAGAPPQAPPTAPARPRTRTSAVPNPQRIAALSMSRMALADLNPHPRNPEIRKHPKPGTPKWETLKASLDHDYFDPLVWNVRNGFLVSGHLRLSIMLTLGFTHADVVVVDYDEPTHMARMLAANRGMGDDNAEGLKAFIAELQGATDFSMHLSGFSADELVYYSPDEDEGGHAGDQVPASGDVGHADLSAAVAAVQDPTVVAAIGEHWMLGGVHRLFVQSMLRPPFDWSYYLCGEEAPPNVRFVPCPDITVALTNKPVALVMVCPSATIASYILSVYAHINGADSIALVED